MKNQFALILILLTVFAPFSVAQEKKAVIHIQFEEAVPADVQVIPALLKYNKDFAFSFILDDAREDAYSLAYKLFNGGYCEIDGMTYPGLDYSDGCGNAIPFRAGIAWYTENQPNTDLHLGTPSYLTYSQAIELNHSGWDFFNHSFDHNAYVPGMDYHWELETNRQTFKNQTGINMKYCVPPSGDTAYLEPAFVNGAIACFTGNYGYLGTGTGVDVTVPVPTSRPVYWRNTVASDTHSGSMLKAAVDNWVATTGQGKQKWWSEFTHRVEYAYTGSSLEFPTFREYFEYMKNEYGMPGRDNGWFASGIEVFEYLKVRDNVSIQLLKNGNSLDIVIDFSTVSPDFRYYDISLLIKGSGHIRSVVCDAPATSTHAESAYGHLVNVDLPDSRFSGIQDIVVKDGSIIKGFPNPCTGTFNLTVPDGAGDISIAITNTLGSRMPVPAGTNQGGLLTMTFRQGDFPEGLYFIKIQSGNRVIGYTKVFIHF
ncbi:MAG: T9SS type A sorting domain-containing protein [Bacteroidales bacterium]|jgi:hypothetical protein